VYVYDSFRVIGWIKLFFEYVFTIVLV
jgi:hypothetical protein